jgi:hypothetical protein
MLAWNLTDHPFSPAFNNPDFVSMIDGNAYTEQSMRLTNIIVALPLILEAGETVEITAESTVNAQYTLRYDILGQALELAV